MTNSSEMSENFRKNLKFYLGIRNHTQAELAHALGVSQQGVTNWIRGLNTPTMKKIEEICAFLVISPSDLLGSHTFKEVKARKIPILGRVVAGIPISAVSDIEGYEEIPSSMAETGDYFALRVTGDSMVPEINDGDIVIVKMQDDVDSGDIAIVMVNGDEATVKKVIKSNEGITLVGFNVSVYPPHFYSNESIEKLPIKIAGKVKQIRRNL